MDVKSVFLYRKIEEEVYVCQPLGFEDLDFLDKVYKVEKALYGLNQAPRAWYETLSTYLLDNGFQKGKIDKTLFIKRHKGDIWLVQVYVDDIIFGSTKKKLCFAFEKLTHEKFYMSSIGELTFFLELQVKQKKDGIFINEAVHKELGDSLVRAATTASSLEVEQDSGNINKTQSKATPNESSFLGTNSGGNTLRSDKDTLKLDELMALCITLQTRILDLEKTKTTQDNEIASLKRRVKKLEKKIRSRTHRLKRLYKVGLTARVESSDNKESLGEDASKQGRIDAIDADEEITLVNVNDVNVSADEEMFVVEQDVVEYLVEVINTAKQIINVAQVSAETTVSAATTTTTKTVDDITLAQVLEEMKNTKPKKKGVLYKSWPIKKKDQIMFDEETALKLQAEFDEEERLSREKTEKEEETNIALIEIWDDIQATIDVDHQLAERMQAQEQEELTELVEGKEKKAGTELIQENIKKQKMEDDKETTDLKQCLEIIPDEEEVTINAIPLAVKSPSIVDSKIHKEGRKSYYQIMRADGKSQIYMIFSQILKIFDRENLEDLYKLVKHKYKSTRPVEDLDLLLWGDLKTMFEPHVEDKVWRNQQEYKVLDWKLYDSCGVHPLRMQHMQIYMLVEKKYPLTPSTLSMMLEKKLMIDYESKIAYQLLKFIIKQLKK
ncbi:putative ribonuclease H-like domain-containing protein [Tanacetum coccineum]